MESWTSILTKGPSSAHLVDIDGGGWTSQRKSANGDVRFSKGQGYISWLWIHKVWWRAVFSRLLDRWEKGTSLSRPGHELFPSSSEVQHVNRVKSRFRFQTTLVDGRGPKTRGLPRRRAPSMDGHQTSLAREEIWSWVPLGWTQDHLEAPPLRGLNPSTSWERFRLSYRTANSWKSWCPTAVTPGCGPRKGKRRRTRACSSLRSQESPSYTFLAVKCKCVMRWRDRDCLPQTTSHRFRWPGSGCLTHPGKW